MRMVNAPRRCVPPVSFPLLDTLKATHQVYTRALPTLYRRMPLTVNIKEIQTLYAAATDQGSIRVKFAIPDVKLFLLEPEMFVSTLCLPGPSQ